MHDGIALALVTISLRATELQWELHSFPRLLGALRNVKPNRL